MDADQNSDIERIVDYARERRQRIWERLKHAHQRAQWLVAAEAAIFLISIPVITSASTRQIFDSLPLLSRYFIGVGGLILAVSIFSCSSAIFVARLEHWLAKNDARYDPKTLLAKVRDEPETEAIEILNEAQILAEIEREVLIIVRTGSTLLFLALGIWITIFLLWWAF